MATTRPATSPAKSLGGTLVGGFGGRGTAGFRWCDSLAMRHEETSYPGWEGLHLVCGSPTATYSHGQAWVVTVHPTPCP